VCVRMVEERGVEIGQVRLREEGNHNERRAHAKSGETYPVGGFRKEKRTGHVLKTIGVHTKQRVESTKIGCGELLTERYIQ
jgi:hypothetical protein